MSIADSTDMFRDLLRRAARMSVKSMRVSGQSFRCSRCRWSTFKPEAFLGGVGHSWIKDVTNGAKAWMDKHADCWRKP